MLLDNQTVTKYFQYIFVYTCIYQMNSFTLLHATEHKTKTTTMKNGEITYKNARIFTDVTNIKVPFHVEIAQLIGRKVVNSTPYYFRSTYEAKKFIDENNTDTFL